MTVDKLYLSHHAQLTLELVCSAQSSPAATIIWSRQLPDSRLWVPVNSSQIEGDNSGSVWTVHRQVGRGIT